MVVAASRTTHSPSGGRRTWTVSSGLMNSHSSQLMTAEMPFPESATASTRCSGVGGSPETTSTFRRVQAVAGPGTNQPPAAKRSSTAGPEDPTLNLDFSHRYRSEDLERDAREQRAVARLGPLERAPQQRGGRPGV